MIFNFKHDKGHHIQLMSNIANENSINEIKRIKQAKMNLPKSPTRKSAIMSKKDSNNKKNKGNNDEYDYTPDQGNIVY